MKTCAVVLILVSLVLSSHAQQKPGTESKSLPAKSSSPAQANPTRGQTNQEPRAVIRTVRGTAEFKSKEGDWNVAKAGTVLRSGALVRSGKDSMVDLFLADNGPVVRVNQNSVVVLEKLDIDRTGPEVIIQTVLDLQKGEILGNVKKLAAQSKYEIKTPVGVVCRIRGTQYSVNADGTVTAVGGEILVTYTKGGKTKQLVVESGHTFTPPR